MTTDATTSGPRARVGSGATFGKYRLEALLGRGSASAVFLALDAHLGRSVALKILLPELAHDDDARLRFLGEARRSAAADHPGVVGVLDSGDVDGVLYVVLQLVRGRDVRWLVEQEGTLGPHLVAVLLGQVAETLDALHARGIVHGGLKPASILVGTDREGRAARALLTSVGANVSDDATRDVASSSHLAAMPDYAAPEQVRGEPFDHRADIYALAAVLFECLAGALPLVPHRGHDGELVLTPLHAPAPRLTDRRPDLPAELDAVVARAMAPNASDRFGSCAAFMAAARPMLEQTHPSVAGTTEEAAGAAPVNRSEERVPRDRLRLTAGVAVVLLLLGALLLTRHVARGRSDASAARHGPLSGGSGRAADALLRRVPSAIRPTCRHSSGHLVGAQVEVTCTPHHGADRVVYGAYADRASLTSALEAGSGEAHRAPAAGDRARCATGGEEERAWRIGSETAGQTGRYRCTLHGGIAEITWTSDDVLVLAEAERADGDLAALFAWWRTDPGPARAGEV